MIEAPWSRAAPVKLWTRCNRDSRDLAGLAGADVPRAGPLPKLKDRSGAFPDEPAPNFFDFNIFDSIINWDIYFLY